METHAAPAVPYDELLDADGVARPAARSVVDRITSLPAEELRDRQTRAEAVIESAGISFTVYDGDASIDRAWPFDIIPRTIDRREWDGIEAGLVQRLTALNAFIDDLYNDQRVVADRIVPAELVAASKGFLPELVGMRPKFGVWAHICGSDLVRGADGTMYVLEDNLRVPSGVSFVLENRMVTKRVFPELFEQQSILPVDSYPERLLQAMWSLSPRQGVEPTIGVLTPGVYNSAYFEHSFLARRMGAQLVEGQDLFVDDEVVYMQTVDGPVRVDVLYRRVDDQFLDPAVFHPKSVLGTAGLIDAWRAGNVALANAPGTGVADDKVVYSYVPDLIRYYLSEEPLLANVPTYRCVDDDDRAYVLDHLDDLVVKPANESGGYGIVVGPMASSSELDEVRRAVTADPRGWVAQPVVTLSTVPTLTESGIAPRHVDLRPFTIMADESYVTNCGLTRVARTEGSLIVNSSQGGGSKDTWIVDTDVDPSTIPGAATPVPRQSERQNNTERQSQSQSESRAPNPPPPPSTPASPKPPTQRR